MIVFLSVFDSKSGITFCLVLLSNFFVDFGIWLTNQSYHWHLVFYGIALVFIVSIFSNLSMPFRKVSDVCQYLGLGVGESKNLIGSLGAGLGVYLETGLEACIWVDADNVMNFFYMLSRHAFIIAYISCLRISLNNTNMKSDRLDIKY